MSDAGSCSRRRLTFSSPPVSQSTACTLCKRLHTQLSSPNSWKNDGCWQIAVSLQLSAHRLVCRPCCNDITRLTKDPDHHPRWEKCQITECVIHECKNTFFSNCSIIPSEDILQCRTLIFLHNSRHLLRFANTITTWCITCQPTQLNCQTWCAVLRKRNARPCPDSETIRTYLEEMTGYEGTLNDGDKSMVRLL